MTPRYSPIKQISMNVLRIPVLVTKTQTASTLTAHTAVSVSRDSMATEKHVEVSEFNNGESSISSLKIFSIKDKKVAKSIFLVHHLRFR